MSERSFTPGPWVATFGDLVRVRPVGSPDVICGVHRIGKYGGNGAGLHNVHANARLIAAAPDLSGHG